MILRLFQWAGLVFMLAGILFGDDTPARGKLMGTWREGTAGGHQDATWLLEDKGDTIRITHSLDGQRVSEVECNTLGRDCELKDSGRHIKVSMWFNGSKLVEMETRGSEIIKRRFEAEEGDAGQVEVIRIVPSGKTEVIRLQRIAESASRK
jgi:hypothetical protein